MSAVEFSCECCGRASLVLTGYRSPAGHFCAECFDEREDGHGVRGAAPSKPPVDTEAAECPHCMDVIEDNMHGPGKCAEDTEAAAVWERLAERMRCHLSTLVHGEATARLMLPSSARRLLAALGLAAYTRGGSDIGPTELGRRVDAHGEKAGAR